MASPKEAEKYLALEFMLTMAVRTIYAMREQKGLLGPSSYAVIVITYAMLATVALWDKTADLAAIVGLIILLAVLMRPTTPKGEKPSTVGRDVGVSLGGFSERVASSPPRMAEGVKADGKGGGGEPGPAPIQDPSQLPDWARPQAFGAPATGAGGAAGGRIEGFRPPGQPGVWPTV